MPEPKPTDPNVPVSTSSTAWSRFENGHPTGWAILLGLGFIFVLVVGFFKGLAELGGWPRTAQGEGYLMGSIVSPLIVPLVGVAIYYSVRKTRHTARRFVSSWVGWALLFSVITSLGALPNLVRRPHFPRNDKEFGRMMVQAFKEASGEVPASQFSTDDSTATMREIFRDVIEFRQQYQDAEEQFDTREMEELYAPSSFRDRKTIEETVRQLQNMKSVEKRFSSLDTIFEKVEARIQQKPWPDDVKRGFLKGMRESLAQGNQSRKTIYQIEEKWLDASVDLYVFAENHISAILVRRNELLIRDPATLDTFNQKMLSAVEFHKQTLEALEKFNQSQATTSKKYGIGPSDIELK